MERLSLPTASGRRFSFRVPLSLCAARWPVRMFSTARESRNFATLTLGAAQGDLVEVLSGISAGEKLVDAPADRDLAGKRIEVQP